MFLLVKYALMDFSAMEVAFFQAVIGAVGLFVIVGIQGGEARAKLGDILRRPGSALLLGALAIAAPFMLIVLGLGCTALGYMLYYRLIDYVGEERAALANYLTPAFALFYGVLLLGETLTIWAVLGLILIIAGAEVTL